MIFFPKSLRFWSPQWSAFNFFCFSPLKRAQLNLDWQLSIMPLPFGLSLCIQWIRNLLLWILSGLTRFLTLKSRRLQPFLNKMLKNCEGNQYGTSGFYFSFLQRNPFGNRPMAGRETLELVKRQRDEYPKANTSPSISLFLMKYYFRTFVLLTKNKPLF